MAPKPVVDDEENIRKFLEQMNLRGSSIYTPSQSSSLTSMNLESASTFAKEANKPQEDLQSIEAPVSTPEKVKANGNTPPFPPSPHNRIDEISPQLVGRIQPPNTPQTFLQTFPQPFPQTFPQDDELSIKEITNIIHNSVGQALGSSRLARVGLSESIHAPQRNSSARKVPTQNIFPSTSRNISQSPFQSVKARRLRDVSYSKVSLAAAEGDNALADRIGPVNGKDCEPLLDRQEGEMGEDNSAKIKSDENNITESANPNHLQSLKPAPVPPLHLRPFTQENNSTITKATKLNTDVSIITEPITKPITEPITEPTTEPTTGSITEQEVLAEKEMPITEHNKNTEVSPKAELVTGQKMSAPSQQQIPPHLRVPPHSRPFIKEDTPNTTTESNMNTEVSTKPESPTEQKNPAEKELSSDQEVSAEVRSSFFSEPFIFRDSREADLEGAFLQILRTVSTKVKDFGQDPHFSSEIHKNDVVRIYNPSVRAKSEWVPPHLRFAKSQVDSSVKTSTAADMPKSAVPQSKEPSGVRPVPIITGSGPKKIVTKENSQGPATTHSTPTPSSILFEKMSPATAWTNSRITAANPATSANLEDAIFLGSWGRPAERDAPAARIRRVRITNLPVDSSPSFVASLVYGGPIESIIVARTSASVLFINADDCSKYYNKTANGIVYKKEGRKEHMAFVERSDDPDIIGGMLRQWMDQGVTRCVAVRDLEDDWTLSALREKATGGRRVLESIEDGTFPPGVPGRRCVTFRFCRMDHAVEFMKMIRINEDWDAYTSVYAPDPCEAATDVHF